MILNCKSVIWSVTLKNSSQLNKAFGIEERQHMYSCRKFYTKKNLDINAFNKTGPYLLLEKLKNNLSNILNKKNEEC